MRDVCVIGGSRYFGKCLIGRFRDAGLNVTVINRGSSAPPQGVTHLIADRDDETALRTAVADRTFDVIVDQVCYTPQQADIAKRVFAGRTGRYVMTSTIEVYDPAGSDAIPPRSPGEPAGEDAVDLGHWPVRRELPWNDATFLERNYGEGKRQAEAVLAADTPFAFATVRSGHVLGGGNAEFTGRLDHYVRRIRLGWPLVIHRENHPASFIHHQEISECLFWAAAADFTGPVNACSHGALDVLGLCEQISARTTVRPVFEEAGPGAAEVSPFAFDRYYAMDNARASQLGFTFSKTMEWLPQAIDEAIAALG